MSIFRNILFVISFSFPILGACHAAEVGKSGSSLPLYVGWASVEITPPKPVALVGQMSKRISQGVLDPLTATALAVETRDAEGNSVEQAVLVSCDLCMTFRSVQLRVRKALSSHAEGLDPEKVFLNATHTHTGPLPEEGVFYGLYDVSGDEGVMGATEYGEFLVARLVEVVTQAWNARKPAGMSWGLGQAVVGHNRRAVYFDGTAVMYGATGKDDFDRLEGYEDHSVPLIFFWNSENALTGVLVNLSCPSQETEGLSVLSADFWHDIREEVKKRYSKELFVFAQCGAAGDISPHLMYRKDAERIMMERKGIPRRQEIAERVADAIDEVFPYAHEDVRREIELVHEVLHLELPIEDPSKGPFYRTDDPEETEIHVLRLGEVAIATNPFELYLDYGVRIQARSLAPLTLISQLSCMHCGYLPTVQAVEGGGYSADKYVVGPSGGRVLVDETVKRINAMWE